MLRMYHIAMVSVQLYEYLCALYRLASSLLAAFKIIILYICYFVDMLNMTLCRNILEEI